MNVSSTYDLYFAGDHTGVDLSGEILDIGVEYGVVKKGGAWYTIGEERFQGRDKAVKYLRTNQDIQEKFYLEIMEKAVS
jgi:recombination protein RecA